MKSFWDTSAAINALVSPSVFARLKHGQHMARVHLIFEFFAIMTGRGIAVKDKNGNPAKLILSESDATAWLRQFAGMISFVELSAVEVLDALEGAAAKGVKGGRVYDYGHALAANQVEADELITRDANDFSGLTNASVVWP